MAGAGQAGRKVRHNWQAVMADYITGNDSLDDVAAKYGINPTIVRGRSAKCGWVTKRQQFKEDSLAAAKTVKLDISVFEKAKFDAFAENTCDIAIAVIRNELARTIRNAQENNLSVDALDLRNWGRALNEFVDVKYRVLGVPAPKQLIELKEILAPIDNVNAELQEAMLEYESTILDGSLEYAAIHGIDESSIPLAPVARRGGNGKAMVDA